MHVLMFDIDGTLINTRGSGLTALQLGFTEVFGHPVPPTIETAGRTDRGIARDLFTAHAIPDSPENWEQFVEAYLRHLVQQLPLRDGHVLPGVVACLEQLATREDVAVGLLTGNTPEGARIKLEHFGIWEHFAFGGYGSLHVERGGVAEAALDAACRALRRAVPADRVWVIGDTPLDIQCARHIGARAVAVATGFHPAPVLQQHGPDLLLDDLRQADRLLASLAALPADWLREAGAA